MHWPLAAAWPAQSDPTNYSQSDATTASRSGRRRLDGRQRLNFLRDFYENTSILGVRMHALTHHEYIDIPGHPVTPLNGNATLLVRVISMATGVMI
eukprot:COSAG01_NODE_3792_length_5691_cov_11.941166_5_plen_96_part_00